MVREGSSVSVVTKAWCYVVGLDQAGAGRPARARSPATRRAQDDLIAAQHAAAGAPGAPARDKRGPRTACRATRTRRCPARAARWRVQSPARSSGCFRRRKPGFSSRSLRVQLGVDEPRHRERAAVVMAANAPWPEIGPLAVAASASGRAAIRPERTPRPRPRRWRTRRSPRIGVQVDGVELVLLVARRGERLAPDPEARFRGEFLHQRVERSRVAKQLAVLEDQRGRPRSGPW